MRWIRLLSALIRAKYKSKVPATATTSVPFRVWLTDIDVSIMNNASFLTIMEMGRLDFMERTNFFKLARTNKWYVPSQAINIQFYRPLKLFQKAEVKTKISFVDDKWIYLEQKIIRNNRVVAACVVKSTIKDGRKTIPLLSLKSIEGVDELPQENYDLIRTHELESEQMKIRFMEDWEVN